MSVVAWLAGSTVGCAAAEQRSALQSGERELVVVVHGLAGSPGTMAPLALALQGEGYEVVNWSYPSTTVTVDDASRDLAEDVAVLEQRSDIRAVHFVGHSMGNIVIRSALAWRRPAKLGRIVMLAPPNQGAAAADFFAPWLAWAVRPLADLTTGEQSTARSLPVPRDVQIGVIAGRYDHLVTPEETHLTGQTDHIVVSTDHGFAVWHPEVQRQTVHFLRTGRFEREPQPSRSLLGAF